MRRICASNASNEWPKATNIRPALLPHHPGHGATHHEGLGLEALLRGAFDVGGLRRVAPALRCRCGGGPTTLSCSCVDMAFERVKVMYPLLHRHEAGAIQAGALAPGQRRLFGRIAILGVFGAVLVAGQVAAMAIGAACPWRKASSARSMPKGRGQRLFHRLRAEVAPGRRGRSPRSQHHSATGTDRHMRRRGATDPEMSRRPATRGLPRGIHGGRARCPATTACRPSASGARRVAALRPRLTAGWASEKNR
jgi:hypothetical protein